MAQGSIPSCIANPIFIIQENTRNSQTKLETQYVEATSGASRAGRGSTVTETFAAHGVVIYNSIYIPTTII
jgi:hypothetical protein